MSQQCICVISIGKELTYQSVQYCSTVLRVLHYIYVVYRYVCLRCSLINSIVLILLMMKSFSTTHQFKITYKWRFLPKPLIQFSIVRITSQKQFCFYYTMFFNHLDLFDFSLFSCLFYRDFFSLLFLFFSHSPTSLLTRHKGNTFTDAH